MKHELTAALLVLFAACSARDESLGETRTPPPLVVEPNPSPDPSPGPLAAPCEDFRLHAEPGRCTLAGSCDGVVLRDPGYECEAGYVCCDIAVGCGANGCGGGSPSMGGEGNEPSAGAGGKP